MTAAIVCIGTELTRGEIENTNATWLAQRLTEAGCEVGGIEVVADDSDVIVATLRRLAEAHASIVCTGGLGPTTDDMTSECAALAAGVPMKRDEASLERIQARMSRFGRKMAASNARQADFPEGAAILPNPRGTAPGFSIRLGQATAYFMPGVPHEMRAMYEDHVKPCLVSVDSTTVQIRLRTFGATESGVNDVLAGIEESFGVGIGYRAHFPEIEVKVAAKDPLAAEAKRRALSGAAEVRSRLGATLFAEGDVELWDVVGNLLREKGFSLATAESCTGGLVSELITSSAGATDYYRGSVVAYANPVKAGLLHVDEALLAAHGAVSEEVARAMAEGGRRALGTDVCLSVTGVAGPGGGSEEKPVGLVHYACALPHETLHGRHVFSGSRAYVRRLSAFTVLDLLRRQLLGAPLRAEPFRGRGTGA